MITEASPILSLLFAKGLGTKTLSQLVDRIVKDEMPIEDILIYSSDVLVERFGLRPNVAEAIQAARTQAERTAEELELAGIQILVRGIEPYPIHLVDVLRGNAPPILFARGDLSVLAKQAVGFCGARSASEKGIRVASDAARQFSRHDVNVISGYAKGVDLAAHRAALENCGVTTIVLAEGILHFRAKRELKSLLDDRNHLVLSEFSPRLPWSGRNAMQRNKTIVGLSDAVICIESGMKGGTHAAAEASLSLNVPLFVADYAQPAESAAGNRHFIARGATPLRGDRSGIPNLKRVFAAIGVAASPDSTDRADNVKNAPHSHGQLAPPKEECMPKSNPQSTSGSSSRYPKRLIEVDLPIARISAHARREKSIRHGHISTLHIWWARRPLAACRAVICASLWPDPADPLCPQAFRDAAAEQLTAFARRVFPKKLTAEEKELNKTASPESLARWEALAGQTVDGRQQTGQDATTSPSTVYCLPHTFLRAALLDFIADFANWDNSTVPAYLETARALTQAAHESLGGTPGTRPLVVDPFAGGGSIPLEALRVGADAFASDLNPVAVLLNKVVLEYIPKYGQRLADEVRKWGKWVKEQAEQELAEFYPKDPDGATPIAYLWARTILSEAPGQGDAPVEVPLMRSMWLAKRTSPKTAMRWRRNASGDVQTERMEILYSDGIKRVVRRPILEIFSPKRDSEVENGTVARGSANCPVSGYTTPAANVREQFQKRRGGAHDSRLLVVVRKFDGRTGRDYRLPDASDDELVQQAGFQIQSRFTESIEGIKWLPDETLPYLRSIFNINLLGVSSWGDLFSPRQALAHVTFARTIRHADFGHDAALAHVIRTLLTLALGKQTDLGNSLCRWEPIAQCPRQLFGRQAIGIVLDYAEGVPIGDSSGSWKVFVDGIARALERIGFDWPSGQVQQADAAKHPLPDESTSLLFTDPPYYDAIPYADLSDFFYVWQKRALGFSASSLSEDNLTPKRDEIVQLAERNKKYAHKTRENFEQRMTEALSRGREATTHDGIGVFVFAHKGTDAWEAMLRAVIDAGWTATASWPIDTENASRLRAQGAAALGSSVHVVCRPRENPDGSLREEIGEWRDVLSELPKRIHEWMPRLASEGVVGADAIFACLGPALEIFSRYSRVEKASGEAVPLREYLEQVWAAVSTEALSLIFKDADAAGLEPDARLTAMWLWTLGGSATATNGNGKKKGATEVTKGTEEDEEIDDEEDSSRRSSVSSTANGFSLEFDAARKIAQGLGIHLEKSESIVEVKGDKARLLPVSERTRYLFGKDDASAVAARGRGKKKAAKQRSLFEELETIEAEADGKQGNTALKPSPGETVLDRVHQAMILFAAGRGEALKRFLVEDGAGTDARFWKLAQSLSALYPTGTNEKRWVDGVLARKKGLGL